jgi:hypothetical protein
MFCYSLFFSFSVACCMFICCLMNVVELFGLAKEMFVLFCFHMLRKFKEI